MKTLLVSANTEQINMPVLPVGLAAVAAATSRAGHEVRLLNLMARESSLARLQEVFEEFAPGVVGVSVRNIDDQSMQNRRFLLDAVKEIVDGCRSLSGVPVILGGAGFSIFPRSVLAHLGADMGIQGEGEAAFPELLRRMDRKEDLRGIPGLILPGDDAPVPPAPAGNLDAFPLPGPEMHPESDVPGDEKIWLPFQTRRGCPMACSYCSTATIEGRITRKRSPDLVVNSIAEHARAGFDRLFFVDNTFNLPLSYAKDLCSALAAAHLRIGWRCIFYPWRADEGLIGNMAEAGCVEVSLGFESGSNEILRLMNKRFNTTEVRRISVLLKKHRIAGMGFLLLGGPGETRETVKESLDFADSLELESMKVTSGIRIYPNTALARIAASEGRIAPADDLLHPAFYMAPGLEGWLEETVGEWVQKRPHWMG